MIIDNDGDYATSGEILVIPISTKKQSRCPNYHIQVHDSYKKNKQTGLYEPCWAKCNLARRSEVRKLGHTWGYMPDKLLDAIVEAYDRILGDDAFDDWQ